MSRIRNLSPDQQADLRSLLSDCRVIISGGERVEFDLPDADSFPDSEAQRAHERLFRLIGNIKLAGEQLTLSLKVKAGDSESALEPDFFALAPLDEKITLVAQGKGSHRNTVPAANALQITGSYNKAQNALQFTGVLDNWFLIVARP